MKFRQPHGIGGQQGFGGSDGGAYGHSLTLKHVRAQCVAILCLCAAALTLFGQNDLAFGVKSVVCNPWCTDHARQNLHRFRQCLGLCARQIQLIHRLRSGGLRVAVAAKGHPEPLPYPLCLAVGDIG